MRLKSIHRDQAIAEAVSSCRSIAEVLRKLGMRVGGGNYETIHRAVRDLSLGTSHWHGQGHRKGSQLPVVPPRPLSAVLVGGSHFASSRLKARLISEGLFAWRCSNCSLSTWMGTAIPLELDHIDGDRHNNTLQNLRLLCPNCHAMTPTYRGRNTRGKRRTR
jgi:5-methylcytosine-specific restriction endonuclease McrA